MPYLELCETIHAKCLLFCTGLKFQFSLPAEQELGLYKHVYRDHSESFPVLDLPRCDVVGAYQGAVREGGCWILAVWDCSHLLRTWDQLLENIR